MWKFILTIIFFTISSENVHSLVCYVSDFESFKLGNVKNLNHTLQDCNYYNNNVKELSQQLQIPENVTTHCYTVDVGRDVVIKGCVRKTGCRVLVDVIKNLVEEIEVNVVEKTKKIACFECGKNGCNTDLLDFLRAEPKKTNSGIERGETSLKCYYCPDPCDLSTARERICGQNIASSHEAVCTTESSKNQEDPTKAIRKCQVYRKNEEINCSENSVCSFCKSDLCNGGAVIEKGQALKCHYCLDACEVSKATERICGQTIGNSQEAVCTKEVQKGSKNPEIAVRKCQIVNKGQEAPCPSTADCMTCKSDLCNSAPATSSSMALLGVVMACFVARFVLH